MVYVNVGSVYRYVVIDGKCYFIMMADAHCYVHLKLYGKVIVNKTTCYKQWIFDELSFMLIHHFPVYMYKGSYYTSILCLC